MKILGMIVFGYFWQLLVWAIEVKLFNIAGDEKISAVNALLITVLGYIILFIGIIFLMKIFGCTI